MAPLFFYIFLSHYVWSSKNNRIGVISCVVGTFSYLEGMSNLLGDHDSSQIVHSSDNASCFHISFSFSRRERPMCRSFFRFAMRNGTQAVPYNYFTNYAVSICKWEKFILADSYFRLRVFESCALIMRWRFPKALLEDL